jgi:hypothetical protein
MNTSRRNRLVAAAAIGILSLIVVAAALVLPAGTLAQAGKFDRAQAGLTQAGTPPPPPPPLHLNPATPTPEPGALQAGASPQTSSSDLEVIPFRPHITLRRGEVPHVATAQKAAGATAPDNLKRPAEETTGPQEAYQAPDVQALLAPMGWTWVGYEGFEGGFPSAGWTLEDERQDAYEYLWNVTNYTATQGSKSAWPAAGGANGLDPNIYYYPNYVDSWMEYGPFDFSNATDIFASFGLWYQTEPQFDWMYFCASVDFINYSCDYWAGDSGGWTDQAYWLTSYAGYSQVWLAWVFQSDFSIVDDGPFVDEIYVWADIGGAPTPTATPDPAGELLQNGSFETGDLAYWDSYSPSSVVAAEDPVAQRPALLPHASRNPGSPSRQAFDDISSISEVVVTDASAVDGLYSAYLWRDGTGNDYLYQAFDAPSSVTDVVINYWFAVTTQETAVGRDFFCASLRPADLSTIWIDLGCIDSADVRDYNYWQETLYVLSDDEVALVAGHSAALVFEMYNTGAAGTWTAGWVDYVRVYATGSSGTGEALDPNEPNDDAGSATAISCGQTIATGVIGDALGGYDADWYRVSNVPAGRLDVDITARTKLPPSALDSVVGLWDNGVNLLTWNDDDGVTFDSYVVYTNTTANATFYVSVESYSGQGSADSFYDLTVQCGGQGGGPPEGGNEVPPEHADAWTVILYLNAEDANFAPILTQYRQDIESFIGGKSGFLNVVILYDGPGTNDTTRYLVQPNGAYTTGTNRWNVGELNMGNRDTLANFVTWAMDQYPADHYYLSVDDHGNGAYGISWDPNSGNDQLTPPELYEALKSATHNGQRKIDIFDYEACLMGLAENAYDLREWVNYVVFSEQISWGLNTYPRYFSDLAAADTPLTVGQRIVDRYHAEALTADGHGYPHTISLIDTSKMVNVGNAVTNFGDTIRAVNTQARKDAIKAARNASQAFAADMAATDYRRAEYIDLWDLADHASSLASTQAAAVKTAVTQAVVRERHASGGAGGYVWNHSGAHGLSIYYPPSESSSAFSSYVAPTIYQMSQDGSWDEFLNWALPDPDARRGMSANRATIKLLGGDAYADRPAVYLPVVLRLRN